MRDQHRALLLGCVLVFFGSCNKDKDENAPNVRIVAPSEGYSLSIPDTLAIRVEVDDDRNVERLVIAVTNELGVPIAPAIAVDVNSTSATIEQALVFIDESTESGHYTIMAYTTDGTNEKRDFVDISIQAAPLRLRAVFIAPPTSEPPPYAITRIDSLGGISDWTTISEFAGAAIDPQTKHLILAGGAYQPLTALPTEAGISTWIVSNQNGAGASWPYFLGLCLDPDDGRCYFGTDDGLIRGFSGNGQSQFNAQTLANHRSYGTAILGDLLVSHQKENVLGTSRLVTYASSSGVLQTSFPLDMETVELFRRSDDQVLVFGNRAGEGVIQDRNVLFGGNFEMRVFSEGPIASVVRLNANTWVIALPNRLVRFDYPSNGISELAAGVAATALAYESATGSLYVGSGSNITLLDPMTGTITGAFSLSEPVGSILPLLNRRP